MSRRALDPHDDTHDQLLQAAGREFAARGFQHASVRAICDAADANVSAVKYHFGSKEELYRAVWRTAATQMLEAEPMPRLGDGDDPRQKLREFMAWFLRLVLCEGGDRPWAGGMLAHETVEPTNALDLFVEHCAGPIRGELARIVRAIVGRGATRKTLDDLTNGVIALCVNPKHSRAILTRLGFPPPTTKAGINRMADRLSRFALGGLDDFAAQQDLARNRNGGSR